MLKEQCKILWVEMDKLEKLEKKRIEEWRISEKIHYMIRFSHRKKKQIDCLDLEALEDFVLKLDKIQTLEDLQRQLANIEKS